MLYFSFTQIQLGPITLYSWGLMVGLAFVIGYWLALREAKKKEIDQNKIFWLAILIFLGSILGARLGSLFLFEINGLMFYGGLFGALIVGVFYIKKAKLDFWEILDVLAPSLALGIFIGRIGCFLINDHMGTVTNLPWAILWPDGILRHPIALYLSLNGLILFLVLWFLRKKLQKPGQLFILFLFWYALSRFLIEFTRTGDPQYYGLLVSQWIGLFVLAGVFVFLRKQT
ncbi:MAG: prolipoprotein diacylglyceryl transferase [Patescibacteria group bacterium]